MKQPAPDRRYLLDTLARLLEVPSPSGYTDAIVHLVADELDDFGVEYELTRRGAIRANIPGKVSAPDRAVVCHLDTLGAMVTRIKDDGRLALAPVGHWPSRHATGARVSVLGRERTHRGTVLPLLASGHVYGDAVDTQPVSWDHIEIRVDERIGSRAEAEALGLSVGDFVAFDTGTEILENGFIVSRHLDDKAGVAVLLTAVRAVVRAGVTLPLDCHPLFTIFEEVGSGASAILHQDVAEMVSIDNATPAPGQSSSEYEVTLCMMDSTGPFDFHLNRHLAELAEQNGVPYRRDVFRHYRTDIASAVEAGNDIRTALLCFGLDASHGYERTHLDSLTALARLLSLYMQSNPLFERDSESLGPVGDLPPVESEQF
jgi:peptidase M42 family hydrolase